MWHYQYPPNTGSTIGNRGVGMYGNWLFFETPDSNLVSLDARTGKERWKVSIADPKLDYTSTVAPVIIGNHVIAGIGGDHLDNPGFDSIARPRNRRAAMEMVDHSAQGRTRHGHMARRIFRRARHRAGLDAEEHLLTHELNLYIVGTGNPNPVMAEKSRKGDNLYTCSIVALNPDTGKIVWYFQPSPHDVHDWAAVETPVLFEGTVDGQRRKLVAQASRNGYFFVLDRATGKRIVSAPFIETVNWAKGINANGQPIPDPEKVSDHRWRIGLALGERRYQLAGAKLPVRARGSYMWEAAGLSACII